MLDALDLTSDILNQRISNIDVCLFLSVFLTVKMEICAFQICYLNGNTETLALAEFILVLEANGKIETTFNTRVYFFQYCEKLKNKDLPDKHVPM